MLSIGRSTVYDWINPKSPRFDPSFPRKITFGRSSVGWLEADVAEWVRIRRLSTNEAFGHTLGIQRQDGLEGVIQRLIANGGVR